MKNGISLFFAVLMFAKNIKFFNPSYCKIVKSVVYDLMLYKTKLNGNI